MQTLEICISPTIRIGREIQCLPYAGFYISLEIEFFYFFFLDKSGKLSKIVSVLQSASVERFDVSRMRDF